MTSDTQHGDLFDTVLVANRGEIACRIIRTLRELGIRSVAVYSDADAEAEHVRRADTAIRIGPAEARSSYLDVAAVVEAALRSGAAAVHPGYGFLSENADFARACRDAGLVFIGPDDRALETMADKIRAKNHVAGYGVPVTPGIAEPGLDDAALTAAADEIGYPILIKPSAGGGGKGMYAVRSAAELGEALGAARRVATSAFGDDTLFLERLITAPRHIEVQILADRHGHVVHLGERECSLQRRHQKVIEEAPSALLDAATRERIGEAACAVARSVDYVGAGTVEFLVSADAPDEFFFMEMNTRLQVEHPVTEAVTGIDLVAWQVRIASGLPLSFGQSAIELRGHAIEARVYAEDPANEFVPSAGRLLAVHEPSGAGIRVDSGLRAGVDVPAEYDPMLSKVIAWGDDRSEAIARLREALADTVVLGVRTNLEYLIALLDEPAVRVGDLDTGLIERSLPGMRFREADDGVLVAAALIRHRDAWPSAADSPWSRPTGWRVGGAIGARYAFTLERGTASGVPGGSAGLESRTGGDAVVVTVSGPPEDAHVLIGSVGDDPTTENTAPARPARLIADELEPARSLFTYDGRARSVRHARAGEALWLATDGFTATLQIRSRAASLAADIASRARSLGPVSPEVRSPMPGTVVAVGARHGEAVDAGAMLVTIEAMKMEHRLLSPAAGIVAIDVETGQTVTSGQLVATVTPHEGDPTHPPREETTL
jgi:acetyl-CoA/propionyl-CoA carboxylase biotin carboxyl carrier protein